MSALNILACFAETESFEGGYVNNPHDPGGPTFKGTTQRVYTAWLLHMGRPNAPVHSASDADLLAIYHINFWDSVLGDQLYDGLDLVMVDTAWGSGPVEAIKFLQRKIGVGDDGHFGVMTLAALKPHFNSTDLLNEICAEREAFFKSLKTWPYFKGGWTVRLNGIHAKALAMNKIALATSVPPLTMSAQALSVQTVAHSTVAQLSAGHSDWLSRLKFQAEKIFSNGSA